MKNFHLFLSVAIIFLFGLSGFLSNLYSQWQEDLRLTNDPGWSTTSFNNAWCIAANGDSVHVVWSDDRDGNSEIYYKRSVDGGINWDPDVRLTDNNAISEYPALAVSESFVHIIWSDSRDGNYEIYYKRSTDGGTSWGNDIPLTVDLNWSAYPSISSSGNNIYVVWMDNRDGNWEIYFKGSIDNGINWSADTRLTNDTHDSYNPSVSAEGPEVHIAWYDYRDGNAEIYYKRSSDGGVNWGTDARLTNYAGSSIAPSISAANSFVHVVWQDDRDGEHKIFYMRSTDDGINWGQDTCLTDEDSSYLPSVAVSGLNVHLVWAFEYPLNREIFYKRSTDRGVSWEQNIRLTNASTESWLPSISVSGSIVNVLWRDERDGNYEIYYKRNPSGNVTAVEDNKIIPGLFQLEQNYPNPFNPSTVISWQSSVGIRQTLKVYDALGNEIVTLVDDYKPAGNYEVKFSAKGGSVSGGDATTLPSGIYFYRLNAGDYVATKKMIFIK